MPTPGERSMAAHLRQAKIEFEIEKQMGPYRVDFFLTRLDLVLELDGRQHTMMEGSRAPYPCRYGYDSRRSQYLALRYGVCVVRIPNIAARRYGADIAKILKECPKALRGKVHKRIDALLRNRLGDSHWWFVKRRTAKKLRGWRRQAKIDKRHRNSFWRPE